ncbi:MULTISPECIES: MBL fold metallo-hydrolase [unclassified Exiguobacterium]|uniref:MBL fold metallo-hydrolase n=1 Tax=unclassified Exiguobacterium TaxID=2644629 RepID=UPI001039E1C5|nr:MULTISPECIES: MBL fold metallo-hydrolase [unclassified Exiguobacterium]TCI32973.1 MBL fold metallo-hydrolase [Exiguobacterium sp. SH4S7]TCI42787.1 MBL fold metallo-hydrolase [Exiguobacterium sp. SH5S32]TCI50200.1 MBL fold metallo-hydrolase [Exiguobacterium sp. SH1S4]TCI60495.1 MBL fold metallo-hydrolase [Exiguobacterium sp. SH0S2]TCI67511.1 MBL fold metallo-hydrolase [Exiguobacterium sp. SH1S1]
MQTLERYSDCFWYMTPVAETDRPIIGAVVGDRHTLMIDAGNSEAHANLFLDALAERGIERPSLVALTHWHWDHIFGLSALRDAVSISSVATKARIERMMPYKWDDDSLDERVESGIEIAFCADAIRLEFGDVRSMQVVLPTVTFDDTVTLDLGGVHVLLKHVGGDHAADAVVAYVPEEKVLFLGDALYANLYASSWRMTAVETLRLLSVLDTFEAEAYVWSHGHVATRAEYEKDRDMLRRLAQISLDSPGNRDAITSQYEQITGREVDEEEQELITFFVNGSNGET